MALALPIMLIMISGLIEFGFALNQYLNTLDAAREAARFATDSDPLDRDFHDDGADPPTNILPLTTQENCGLTGDFYMQAACIAVQTMSPVDFNTATDDVVVSVFRVLSGTVIDRWPNCSPSLTEDCPVDPPSYPETLGEWHLYGRGNGCGNGLDDDGDHTADDGCPGGLDAVGDPEFCNPLTEDACHPSRLTNAVVESKLEADAPDSAVLLVEVFYDYPHVMQLPWITPFVPNPLPLHTYTILPLPAAEPSLTITGTVSQLEVGGGETLLSGVTITFTNGLIAITDSNGVYIRTGLSSGFHTWSVDLSGTNCSISTPASYTAHMTTSDLYDQNFVLSSCIDVAGTATYAAATTTSEHLTDVHSTNVALTATQVMSTATAVAATQTAEAVGSVVPTEAPIPTETATISPSCSDTTVSNTFSQVTIVSPDPPNVQADGSSAIEVLVQLVNECNTTANMNDRTVSLSSSRGSDVVTPGSAQTDGSGQAAFFVTSSEMSVWNSVHHDFENSTFTASSGGTTILDTAGGAFVCVGGAEGTAVNGDQVAWTFINDSGISRRLVEVVVSWSQPEDPLNKLLDLSFDGVSIWNSSSHFDNPSFIGIPGSTDWQGVPADRILDPGQSHDLLLTYSFSVTGGQSFTLDAQWDNTSGASFCDSNQVTVIR